MGNSKRVERKNLTLYIPSDFYAVLAEEARTRGYSANELILFTLHAAVRHSFQ